MRPTRIPAAAGADVGVDIFTLANWGEALGRRLVSTARPTHSLPPTLPRAAFPTLARWPPGPCTRVGFQTIMSNKYVKMRVQKEWCPSVTCTACKLLREVSLWSLQPHPALNHAPSAPLLLPGPHNPALLSRAPKRSLDPFPSPRCTWLLQGGHLAD